MKFVIFLCTIIILVCGLSCHSIPGKRKYDICIYGATSSGIMAAYAAKKLGNSVIIIEPSNHIGGLTTGGLGQTDIGNKDAITGLSRNFYKRVGKYYANEENWNFEPKVASKVFNDYLNEAGIEVIKNTILEKTIKNGERISMAIFRHLNESIDTSLHVKAKVFIDCTYEGDLMAQSGVSYTVGRESNEVYHETQNGVQMQFNHQFPDNIDPYKIAGDSLSGLLWGISDEKLLPGGSGDRKVQAYNYRICLTDSLENMIPITRPQEYDSCRYELLLRLIRGTGNTNLYSYFIWSKMPGRKTDINNRGAFSTDMIGANWDYPEGDFKTRQIILKNHLEYTLGLFYFIGHDSRVPDNMREEMLKWGYPKDEYIDNNNFTPQLYIREARRMIGEYVMTEHNCRGNSVIDDPAGLAAYTMDSHNCQRLVVNGMVKNEGNVEVGGFPPYPISYRSITPKRSECTNILVPVCLSASHIAYGSIRMEPVFMVLGQSAGIAASLAIKGRIRVQEINLDELHNVLHDWEY